MAFALVLSDGREKLEGYFTIEIIHKAKELLWALARPILLADWLLSFSKVNNQWVSELISIAMKLIN